MNKEIITEKELIDRLDVLGNTLSEECNKEGGGIVFVCVMKGGYMFFSDLVKRIKYPIEVDFIRCSSYEGQEKKEFTLHYDIEEDVTDKTVYLVDDIFDSGNTMKMLTNHFNALPHRLYPLTGHLLVNLFFGDFQMFSSLISEIYLFGKIKVESKSGLERSKKQ